MEPIDLSLISFVLLYCVVAPFTKVEESFNIQAIHDIFFYGQDLSKYDHFEFPGVVPRSFFGALIVAMLQYPAKMFSSTFVIKEDLQMISRAVVGALNAFMLVEFRRNIQKVFGKRVSVWFMLITIAQFHLIYYASRTLPNMMAMPLVLYAYGQVINGQINRAITLLLFTAVVFRVELVILAASLGLFSLGSGQIDFRSLLVAGMRGVGYGALISITVDSYFWDKFPMIPEVNSFFFNVVNGKSSEWGIEPFSSYFRVHLPNLTNNPTILALLPIGLFFHQWSPEDDQYDMVETEDAAALEPKENNTASARFAGETRRLLILRTLFATAVCYILVYSLQPHKELRFIIYVMPLISLVCANGASAAWEMRSKNLAFRILSAGAMITSLCAVCVSLLKLMVSRMNYPGGEALQEFHYILETQDITYTEPIVVHMDVPVCMTGATRFLQRYDDAGFLGERPFNVIYDKTEDRNELMRKWPTYDFLIGTVDDQQHPIPSQDHYHWEKRATVQSYAGINGDEVRKLVNTYREHPEGVLVPLRATMSELWQEFQDESFFGVFEYLKTSFWDRIILTKDTAFVYEKVHD